MIKLVIVSNLMFTFIVLGVIGDWKNWFTVAQNEKLNEIYKEEMKICDVDFIYEQ